MKLFAALLIVFMSVSNSLRADVIRLRDGSISLGSVSSADANGIVVESFGESKKFSQSEILKHEKDLTQIQGQQFEIRLKDNSILKGRIQNYDEEVGLLLNTDFGTITMPIAGVRSIRDLRQRKLYSGSQIHLGLGGGYYFIAGKFSSYYSGYPMVSTFAELNANFLRGLFFGVDFTWCPLNVKDRSDLKYNSYMLRPYAIYRYMDFRTTQSSFINRFVPLALAGAGMNYITLKDKRIEAPVSKRNEILATYTIGAGFDFYIIDSVILRMTASWIIIPQKSAPFNLVPLNLAVIYAF